MEENMSKTISQLRNIKKLLRESDNFRDMEMYLKRLSEIVISMKGNKAADEMRLHIMHYYMDRVTKDELIDFIDEFIRNIKAEAESGGVQVDTPSVEGVCSEMKDACSSIFGVIKKEVKAASKDIGKTIREDTPNCAEALNYLKGMPKRAEKNLKKKVRNWLMSDEEEKH